MAFSKTFNPDSVREALRKLSFATKADVRAALASANGLDSSAAALYSDAASDMLEELAQTARRRTQERFGKTVALYAPLYLSNECVCTCTYCGFSRELDIKRRTLRIDEVAREARFLHEQGFRNILLVSAEHPKFVSPQFIAQCIAETKRFAQYVGVEVASATAEEYAVYVEAGCDGVVLYQESYDPQVYATHHLGGPKKKYFDRLDAPERASKAGVKHLGLGALLGLGDWRFEALALLEHARYLQKHCWRSQLNISFPRINPAEGGYVPQQVVSDAHLVQLICAFRIALPWAGIVLSTREAPSLRDKLFPLGVTHMSAGSSTVPGGYAEPQGAGEQFSLADHRSTAEVVARLRELGYDPVFKDWEHMQATRSPLAV